MASSKSFLKINDLSQSPFRQRFFDVGDYIPTSNSAISMGRVSILKNKIGGKSDLAQLEHIDKYVDQHGYLIARPWDVAETAFKHEDRKFLREMDQFLRANPKVKHVIFSHQSRACRNENSANMIEDWILNLKVVVHFARENRSIHYRSDTAAWILWHVMVQQHQRESENIRLNAMDGMIKRMEMGLYPARSPFGYKNTRSEEHGESIFVFNGDKASYMRRAFEMFASANWSVSALKKELDRQFPHLRPTPCKNQLWNLLKNPFYYGDFDWNGVVYVGPSNFHGHPHPQWHPPLVTFDLWSRVQSVFKMNGRSIRKVTERNHPYLGLIRCGGMLLDESGKLTDQPCGSAITTEEKRKKYKNGKVATFVYLHCSKPGHVCSQRNVKYMRSLGRSRAFYTEAEVESLLKGMFAKLRSTPEDVIWMQKELLKEHDEKKALHRQESLALHGRRLMLLKWIDEAYTDKLERRLPESEWQEKSSKWRLELDQVQKQVASLDDQKDAYIQRGVLLIELAQLAESVYEKASPEKRRRMVEFVSSNLRLRDGTIEFDYRKPFDLLSEGADLEKWRTLVGAYRMFLIQNPDYKVNEFEGIVAA